MKLTKWINYELGDVVQSLEKAISRDDLAKTRQGINIARREAIYVTLDRVLASLFPGVLGVEPVNDRSLNLFLGEQLRCVSECLSSQIERILNFCTAGKSPDISAIREKAETAVIDLIKSLPDIRRLLLKDIEAAYEGDPAALSLNEVLMSYPCIEAIATYRIAHQLYQSDVPIIPRIMTERAHSHTGIDIHPGAVIGPSFFIDHGTGVVIGETTVIGKNVKLYQGVTLGALSFPKDSEGNLIKNVKRHPEIRDNVIIYAHATVLGGDTIIGRNSIIGGNCWVTSSVPPQTQVSAANTSAQLKKLSSGGQLLGGH